MAGASVDVSHAEPVWEAPTHVPTRDTLAVLHVTPQLSGGAIVSQLDELAASGRVRQTLLLTETGLAAPAGPGQPVLRGSLSAPRNALRLRKALTPTDRHFLELTGTQVLGAGTITRFLEYHEASDQSESVFTPSFHESWQTPEAARATAVDFLRGNLWRRSIEHLARRSARPLPSTWKHALRQAASRPRRRPRPAASAPQPASAAPPTSGAPDPTTIESPRWIGSLADQLDLLTGRLGETNPFPSVVNLVLSNICNLKCVMCPYHSPRYEEMKDQEGFFGAKTYMTDETFDRVAREAGAHGATLKMGQLEETLVHPKLIEWVGRARDYGVKDIHITTNGTLLTPRRSEALMRNGVTSIYVSLDAATPETYAKVRGWKRGLPKVWEHIDALIENRDKYAPETSIFTSMILQPEAAHEHDPFVEMWSKKGIDGVVVYQLSTHEGGDDHFTGKFFEHQPPENRHACQSVFSELYVYPAGEVSMCCTTMILVPRHGIISVGNVAEKSLQEIWLDEPYTALRRRLLRNDIEGDIACQDCDIWHSSENRVEHRDGYRVEMNPTCAMYYFDRVK